MTEVQDDDQWLYGEDGAEKEVAANESASKADTSPDADGAARAEKASVPGERSESPGKENDAPAADKEGAAAGGSDDAAADVSATDGDKSGDGAAGESSDEDDLTITIGELKKAAEVMTPGQQHLARFQPKAAPTTGLKDEDFASAGKVNGVAVADLNLSDYEDKPWRKPGADLSDYFNYGFNEQTWFKYCDRQKRMRTSESGSGLNSLGINVGKPFGFLSSSDNKSNGTDTNGSVGGRPRPSGTFHRRLENQTKPEGNSIQVMTADRRQYSNKVMAPPFMSGPPPPIPQGPYDDMDFGGSMYGGPPGPPGPDNGYYPPASYFNTPPPSGPPPPVSGPPPNFNAPPVSWSNPPPPMVPPPQMVPPATHDVPPPRWGGEVPPSPALTGGHPLVPGSPPPSYRSDRDREDSDEDRRRSRRHRRASRSPSRSRHRTRSRSRSPSHKHKRKKSKRDRDAD